MDTAAACVDDTRTYDIKQTSTHRDDILVYQPCGPNLLFEFVSFFPNPENGTFEHSSLPSDPPSVSVGDEFTRENDQKRPRN